MIRLYVYNNILPGYMHVRSYLDIQFCNFDAWEFAIKLRSY